MLISLLKHYLDTDTVLKVFQSVYCFTTSISHGVDNYFPRLWGTGISDAIFYFNHFKGKRKVFHLCSQNLGWRIIGSVACLGLLLVIIPLELTE